MYAQLDHIVQGAYAYEIYLRNQFSADYIDITTNSYSDAVVINDITQLAANGYETSFSPLIMTLSGVEVALPYTLTSDTRYLFKLVGQRFDSTKLSFIGSDLWGIENVDLYKPNQLSTSTGSTPVGELAILGGSVIQ